MLWVLMTCCLYLSLQHTSAAADNLVYHTVTWTKDSFSCQLSNFQVSVLNSQPSGSYYRPCLQQVHRTAAPLMINTSFLLGLYFFYELTILLDGNVRTVALVLHSSFIQCGDPQRPIDNWFHFTASLHYPNLPHTRPPLECIIIKITPLAEVCICVLKGRSWDLAFSIIQWWFLIEYIFHAH